MQNSKNSRLTNKAKTLLARGFKKRAEEIAAECRKLLNLNETDPLPALSLTAFLKIHVKETKDVDNIDGSILSALLDNDFGVGFSAVTIQCLTNNRLMIVHNHTHAPGRKESNLMHECAHILLNHKMEEFDSTNGYNLRNYNALQEEEASFLGFCLQLPLAALKKHYIFQKKSKEEISDYFNATMHVVNYRIRILGLESFKINYLKKYK
jgi:Zn-dependent peptidase ImmA (M78 family)